ncbi:MAG TPA: hypothetical protein VJT74_03740 [Pyrinomonadaceae bacterium]|nr:hypothetical protein [Pyrinomonadaceae bacterium]
MSQLRQWHLLGGSSLTASLAFVDTRNPRAWVESDVQLPGAIRVPADEVEGHPDEIPQERAVITYCT